MEANRYVRQAGLAALVALAMVASGTDRLTGAGMQRDDKMKHATGEFDVTLSQQADEEPFAMGRMTIDKTFRGDLTGTSKGQMLSFLNEARDSGGYVAIERVTGTLAGKKGSFALQHSSTMERGAQHQSVMVVPGSGTGELSGLIGSMVIEIKDRKHLYDFTYALGDLK
jgi:hypothetical protein